MVVGLGRVLHQVYHFLWLCEPDFLHAVLRHVHCGLGLSRWLVADQRRLRPQVGFSPNPERGRGVHPVDGLPQSLRRLQVVQRRWARA